MPAAAGSQLLEDELRTILGAKDNLLQAFFVLLWSKAADSGAALEGVRIPDTAILNHSRVIEYYFTSIKDGTIKKKSKANQTTAHLLEELAKKAKKNTVSGMAATLLCRDTTRSSGVRLEPMTLDETRHMLERESTLTGTIQGFIEPHSEGGKHYMHDISINWTPNLFYAEKRVSPVTIPKCARSTEASTKGAISSSAMAERQMWFCTGDENPGVTSSTSFSSYTSRELERMCNLIAQHIEGAYKMRLMGLDLHAVIDAKDQLWVTHCTGIRVSKLDAPTKILIDVQMRMVEGGAATMGSMRQVVTSSTTEPAVNTSTSSGVPPRSTSKMSDTDLASETSHVSRSSVRSRLPQHQSKTQSRRTTNVPCPKKPLLCVCRVCATSNLPPTREEIEDGSEPPFNLEESMRPFAEVARKHLQFSLSVMSFFATNKPGTLYEDESVDPQPSSVPSYVQLIRLNDFRYEKNLPLFYKRLNALGIRKSGDGRVVPNGTSGSRSGTPPPADGEDDDDEPPEEMTVSEYKRLRDTDRWLDERIMVCDECAHELTAVVADAEVGKDGKIRVPANPFPNGEASTSSPIKLGHFAEDTETSQKRKEKGVVEAPRPRQQSPYNGTNTSSGGGVSANAEVASRIAKQKAVPTQIQMGEEVQASRSRVVIVSTPDGGEEEAEL